MKTYRRHGSILARVLGLILCLGGVLSAQTPPPAAALSITSPLDYQVFQRSTRLVGTISIQGHAPSGASRVEVLITGRSVTGPLPSRWQRVAYDRGSGQFHGGLKTPAGGFYTVQIRIQSHSQTIETATVAHVGVGEVFVIAGQSNSTNYGEVRQVSETGMVTTFSGNAWRLANDPQPGVQDNSTKGSFIPSFGDSLYRRYGVPIGVASVGHGSTSVRQWLPAGDRVEVMPTMTKYITVKPDGTLVSDGTLFNGMMERIQQLGVGGFRAVLWHQGESDSHQPPAHDITAETYRRMMERVIVAARNQAGWKLPWFVAEATYHTPEDQSCPPIRAAQASLWQSGIALEGPDTDTLTSAYRQNEGKGTHFNDAGLKAHGVLWAKAVEAYLDLILR
ncbi:protein of unknown function [Bryocella elongata]|uniref:Sialate O-acetylesterase domain-containing protein n=1 Tax=Bryocella elongata TaxID=863522 RepID=A0A1H5S219_9BACT|nr:sialate O-acetylesterase [Bryocella elongata]SEF44635.1 protein of unknown function [Bryocella elongata]